MTPRSEENVIRLDGETLTIETVAEIALGPEHAVVLSDDARERMSASRALVERWVESDEIIYGVTTGFGEFANVVIDRASIETLQTNLIRSHAVGAGEAMPQPVIRAMIALRANALAKGFSGIRVEVVEALLTLLRADILPYVPTQGSVGSSGDLVPLAHLVLGLMGEGEVWMNGRLVPASEGLAAAGVTPVRLRAKEGLALINGTQLMTAYGSLALAKLKRLARTADVIGALSVEALRGTDNAYAERLHLTRPHPGQLRVAANLRSLLADSAIRESHRYNDDRVQDAYSIRCIPQIHGASRDAIDYIDRAMAIEINSATDNPLIFADEESRIEGGNFHGQPVALPLDMMAIAAAELANVSERRTERLVNGALSRLPRFLTERGGLNSGYMIAQYTAAAIVSENKILSHPASVDSIPTSANQEDHNSMGSIAARKAFKVVDNLQTVLAIEYLCAVQGIDFLRPLRTTDALEEVHAALREHVPHLDDDRILYNDLRDARALIEQDVPFRAAFRHLSDLG